MVFPQPSALTPFPSWSKTEELQPQPRLPGRAPLRLGLRDGLRPASTEF